MHIRMYVRVWCMYLHMFSHHFSLQILLGMYIGRTLLCLHNHDCSRGSWQLNIRCNLFVRTRDESKHPVTDLASAHD